MSRDMDDESRRDQDLRLAAWYQALYQAWFATRLETQRSILTLSTAGVGLCATLIFTLDRSASAGRWLLFFAAASFLVSMAASIRVFWVNADVVRLNLSAGEPDSTAARAAEASSGAAFRGSLLTFGIGAFLLLLSAAAHVGSR